MIKYFYRYTILYSVHTYYLGEHLASQSDPENVRQDDTDPVLPRYKWKLFFQSWGYCILALPKKTLGKSAMFVSSHITYVNKSH